MGLGSVGCVGNRIINPAFRASEGRSVQSGSNLSVRTYLINMGIFIIINLCQMYDRATVLFPPIKSKICFNISNLTLILYTTVHIG